MEDFLDIMLPMLLHSAPPGGSQRRKRPLAKEPQQQQQVLPSEEQLVTNDQSEEQQQKQRQPPPKRKMNEKQKREPVQRQAHRRLRSYQQRQRKDTAETKVCGSALMAAQAVATVLRRAARDEEVFYDCVASITGYFLV